MTRLGSRAWSGVAAMLLAGLPLAAQDRGTAPPPMLNAIPEGQSFLIRLNDKLDTSNVKQGHHFTAKLAEDLVA